MKFDKFLIWTAVTAIHVGLVALCLICARKGKQQPDAKPAPAVIQPAKETPGTISAGSIPPVPVAASPAASAPASPAAPAPVASAGASTYMSAGMPTRYQPGMYTKANKALSKELQGLVKICGEVVVLDVNSHTILWEKDSTKTMPIASLTKLVTAQMLLERIATDQGMTLQTKVKITKDDFARTKLKPLCNVYFGINEELTLQEFLKAMIISSANDCAYIVGKYLGGGDLNAFVKSMHTWTAQLGLSDMKFNNPHGLPVVSGSSRSENMGCAMDIAFLAERSLYFPEIMKWAGTKSEKLRENTPKPFDLNSTNKLLRGSVNGVDGLKTGYTDGAGQCIAVTCKRDGRRIIVIVMGVPANGDHGARRDSIARKLLEWAYTV